MKRLVPLAAVAALMLIAAAPSIKDEMKGVVEPASNILFAVGGEVDPSNDPKPKPAPDARWMEAASAAIRLKGVADAMLAPDQLKPGADWAKAAQSMADISATAEAAAKAKDGAKLAQAANDLGDTCTACHSKYKPQT